MNKNINPNVAVTSPKESFRDYFFKGVSLPELVDGNYAVTVENIEFIAPVEMGKDPYVRVSLRFDNGRLIYDNRFEQGFEIFVNTVKAQLELSNIAITIPELVNRLIGSEVKIWIKHVVVEGKTYRNVYYAPPKTTQINANVKVEDF